MAVRDLADADVAYCTRWAGAYWRQRPLGPAYEHYHAACIDGLLRARETFDATKGATWRTWVDRCMAYAVRQMSRTLARDAARDALIAQALRRQHRQRRPGPQPAAVRAIEEQHDLAVFTAWVARRPRGDVVVRCLAAIAADLRPGEMAQAEGVSAAAISQRLRQLQQRWQRWSAQQR